jgi:hypothetical protein
MTEGKTYTLEETHLYFAKTLNGKVWELLGKADRSPAENEEMLHAAYASCWHWLAAGTPLHHQRGEWLIAHVYTVLGYGEPALRHARRCLALTEGNASLMQDFDWAYAHEGLARAFALAGDRGEALHHLQIAQEKGEEIKNDEDKNIFLGDLQGGEWFGIAIEPA